MLLAYGANQTYVFLLSCIGVIFSFSWFRVNMGSKSWQDNWERQVDLLEDQVIGPLYKTLIVKAKTEKFYSVSKINLELSSFVSISWRIIAIFHLISFLIDNEFIAAVSENVLNTSLNYSFTTLFYDIKANPVQFSETLLFIAIIVATSIYIYRINCLAVSSTFFKNENLMSNSEVKPEEYIILKRKILK